MENSPTSDSQASRIKELEDKIDKLSNSLKPGRKHKKKPKRLRKKKLKQKSFVEKVSDFGFKGKEFSDRLNKGIQDTIGGF